MKRLARLLAALIALVMAAVPATSAEASGPKYNYGALGYLLQHDGSLAAESVQDELRSRLNVTDVPTPFGSAHSGAEAPRLRSSDFVAPSGLADDVIGRADANLTGSGEDRVG